MQYCRQISVTPQNTAVAKDWVSRKWTVSQMERQTGKGEGGWQVATRAAPISFSGTLVNFIQLSHT